MPAAIPLVAAGFSVYAGVGAIAAGSALVGGLMVAGGALTAVGSLTGNKKLSTLGAVLGLAGGVGSLASEAAAGSTLANTGAETSQELLNAQAPGVSTTTNAGGVVSQGAADTAAAVSDAAGKSGGLVSDAINSTPPAALAANEPLGAPQFSGNGTQYDLQRGVYDGGSPAQSAAASPVDAAQPQQSGLADWRAAANSAPQTPVGASPGAADFGSGFENTTPSGQAANAAPQAPGTSPDWWNKLKQYGSGAAEWMQKNPNLTMVGGGLVYGAMNNYGQQQLAEDNMKRQMRYQDWVRQRYSDAAANLRVPGLVSTAPATGGIISGTRG